MALDALVSLNVMLVTIVDFVCYAKFEVALFCFAVAFHHIMFGRHLRNRWQKKAILGDDVAAGRVHTACVSSEFAPKSPREFLRSSLCAFEQGNHKQVLRCWNQLKRTTVVPAEHLAQVVESMRRFKKDGQVILTELTTYLKRNAECQSAAYINGLLEPLARTPDSEVVGGIMELLPELGVEPDEHLYEALLCMHFSTRGFVEVKAAAAEMAAKGIRATARASMVLLKAELRNGNIDEAVRRYREACWDSSNQGLPQYVLTQLLELACSEHRLGEILDELGDSEFPIAVDTLNIMLAECVHSKNWDLLARVEALGVERGISRSSRTYHLLLKAAAAQGNRDSITRLLDDMASSDVDWGLDVARAVIAAADGEGVELVDKLLTQVNGAQAGQIPIMSAFVRFYSDAGEWGKACDVFDRYLRPQKKCAGNSASRSFLDAKTERSLTHAALQCNRGDISDMLLGISVQPRDVAKDIATIQGCAAKGNLAGAFRVFRALEEAGKDLSSSVYNTVLDACVECRDLAQAEDWMARMKRDGAVDAISYNTVIKAHLRNDQFQKARALMTEMGKQGFPPNCVTYNELINVMVRSDRQRSSVWEVVDEMQASGVKPNRITCSILLKTLQAKASQHEILRTMELATSLDEPMDEILLSSVVEACVRVGKPTLLSSKLKQLQETGCVSVNGAHTFGSLIKAYGQVKDIESVWSCWKSMRSRRIKPTSITIGCMVEAVVSNGDVDGGYELIQQLMEDDECRHQVNAVVYCSVIKGYSRSHRMDRVLAVFNELISRGIKPSVVTFNALIDACARNGRMDAVPQFLQDMRGWKLQPNIITFSTLVKGFCQRGDIPAAMKILEDVRKDPHLQPDEVMFNTILDGCAANGLVAEGERVFAEMQAQGLQPGNYAVSLLVKMLGSVRKVGRAFELVEEITRKCRLKPNGQVYESLIQAALNGHDLSRALATFEKMGRQHIHANGRTCQALVRGCLANRGFAQAAGVLRLALGLGGAEGTDKRVKLEPSFVGEAIRTMAQDKDSANLAAELVDEIRLHKPKFRLDPALQGTGGPAGLSGAVDSQRLACKPLESPCE